jgi:Protein phosphatase 2C
MYIQRVMGNLAVSRAFGDAEFKKNISYGVQHDTDATANNSSSSGNSSSTSPDSNEPSVCGPLVIAEPVSLWFN